MVGGLNGDVLAVEFFWWCFGLFVYGADELRDFLWFGDLEVDGFGGWGVCVGLSALVWSDVAVEVRSGEIGFVVGFGVDVWVGYGDLSEVGGGGFGLRRELVVSFFPETGRSFRGFDRKELVFRVDLREV